jgi:hypothetical protein
MSFLTAAARARASSTPGQPTSSHGRRHQHRCRGASNGGPDAARHSKSGTNRQCRHAYDHRVPRTRCLRWRTQKSMGHIAQCGDNIVASTTRWRRMRRVCASKTASNNGRQRAQNNAAINECLTWACKQQKNVCIPSVKEGMACAATQRCVARKTKSVGFVFARRVPRCTLST